MARTIVSVTQQFMENAKLQPDKMYEVENFHFDINPQRNCAMFNGSTWFEMHVAAAQYLWFVKADRNDQSIYEYLPSYAKTANKSYPIHNSNYGYYFYKLGLIDKCVDLLKANADTRRACFMINNNDVAFSEQNDKLCTNSVSFRIRDKKLNMTVHMRSNDFLNMMPYDMFQFCMIYGIVFSRLKVVYKDLSIGKYHHCADSMHTDKASFVGLKTYFFAPVKPLLIPDFNLPDFEDLLHKYLSNYLTFYKTL